MRVAIIGGELQGIEAAYLAKKAGWEIVLIDRNKSAPAQGLCDKFININIIRSRNVLSILESMDLIIPALENKSVLKVLESFTKHVPLPIMHDSHAYNVSSSKVISNELFARLQIPAPLPWPKCGLPIIIKPSSSSGSRGVLKIDGFENFLEVKFQFNLNENWIVEQYLEGPSFSLEVIGYKGIYKVLQVTELQMDEVYDCKRVLAPAALSDHLKKQFAEIALSIAKSLALNGLMDVETILHDGQLKVLEIDARLPSQTPTAVYKSCGINMLEIIKAALMGDKSWVNLKIQESTAVIYEHIKVASGKVEVLGEHVMAGSGILGLLDNFFGADEAITNYAPGKTEWVATLILTAKTREEVWEKRYRVISQIKEEIKSNNILHV